MPIRNDPSALRWLVGHELRAARLQARRTQTDAARELGCTGVKINYMETGRNHQQPDEIEQADALLRRGRRGGPRLVTLAGRGDQGTWWASYADALPDWFRTFVGLEGLARGMFVYEQMVFDGQLQTREYALHCWWTTCGSAAPRPRTSCGPGWPGSGSPTTLRCSTTPCWRRRCCTARSAVRP
jgi:hypothetical protein